MLAALRDAPIEGQRPTRRRSCVPRSRLAGASACSRVARGQQSDATAPAAAAAAASALRGRRQRRRWPGMRRYVERMFRRCRGVVDVRRGDAVRRVRHCAGAHPPAGSRRRQAAITTSVAVTETLTNNVNLTSSSTAQGDLVSADHPATRHRREGYAHLPEGLHRGAGCALRQDRRRKQQGLSLGEPAR